MLNSAVSSWYNFHTIFESKLDELCIMIDLIDLVSRNLPKTSILKFYRLFLKPALNLGGVAQWVTLRSLVTFAS